MTRVKNGFLLLMLIIVAGCGLDSEEANRKFDHKLDLTASFNPKVGVTYAKDFSSEKKIYTSEELGLRMNDEIQSNVRKEVNEIINELLHSVRANDYQGIFQRLPKVGYSEDQMKKYSTIYTEALNELIQDSTIEIKAEYYGKLNDGLYDIESPIDNRYLLVYRGDGTEKYLVFIKLKRFRNEEYVTFELSKLNEEWALKSIGIGSYKKDNKTSFQWLEESKKLMEEGRYLPAFIRHFVAYVILPANSYPKDDHVKELFQVRDQIVRGIDDELRESPVIVDKIDTNPAIYSIYFDYWLEENNFGYVIHYVTNIKKTNKKGLEDEAAKLHAYLKTKFNYDKVGHYAYVAYFDLPNPINVEYPNSDVELFTFEY